MSDWERQQAEWKRQARIESVLLVVASLTLMGSLLVLVRVLIWAAGQ